jgi:AraC-like DNA-binding protein
VTQTLPDGGYSIHDRFEIEGEGSSVFVFARGWLLEVVEIESGEYGFLSDDSLVGMDSRRFGVFYPAFSLVRPHVTDARGSVDGVGAVHNFGWLPPKAIMFETKFRGRFTAVEQAREVLADARNSRPIEINTHASPLSLRVKMLINQNYLIFPSIAKIAARLRVSHEHMTRQFKRDFGLTPSKYLHHLRVAEATHRLTTGEEIIDISADVGYNDLSRFYKQFKSATRTSPGECREILQKR